MSALINSQLEASEILKYGYESSTGRHFPLSFAKYTGDVQGDAPPRILPTKPDAAEFKTVYEYPVKVGGKPVCENRITRLRLGERLMEVETFFADSSGRSAKPLKAFPHEVAIGIVTQNKGPEIKFLPERRGSPRSMNSSMARGWARWCGCRRSYSSADKGRKAPKSARRQPQ